MLSAEQKRWRSNLAAYLGRPVDVPLLAPGAPVLDMQELFTRVRRGVGQLQLSTGKARRRSFRYSCN
jgi:hypothetical protein